MIDLFQSSLVSFLAMINMFPKHNLGVIIMFLKHTLYYWSMISRFLKLLSLLRCDIFISFITCIMSAMIRDVFYIAKV